MKRNTVRKSIIPAGLWTRFLYNFEGRRYDVGDKLGFLEVTVDFALKRPELRDDFIDFLRSKAETIRNEEILKEVAVTAE